MTIMRHKSPYFGSGAQSPSENPRADRRYYVFFFTLDKVNRQENYIYVLCNYVCMILHIYTYINNIHQYTSIHQTFKVLHNSQTYTAPCVKYRSL